MAKKKTDTIHDKIASRPADSENKTRAAAMGPPSVRTPDRARELCGPMGKPEFEPGSSRRRKR